MSKQMYSHVSLYSLTLCKVLVSVCDSPEMFFSKVWISFAQFEAYTATDESIIQARYVKWLSYILDRDRDHDSSSEWETYSHATPDEPLRRAQSGQLNEIIFLSCRKGFMAEHLSWNSFYCFKCCQKICELESSEMWIIFLHFAHTINIIFQDCLRTRQQISQKRRGERRTSDGTRSVERVRGIIKIGW